MDKKEDLNTIGTYILQFGPEVQRKLNKIRQVIREAAPDASEKISYQMPTFWLNGNLVHFAAFKNHIGFYPTPNAIENFADELAVYKTAKGSIQFPIKDEPPYDLIRRIVLTRVLENTEKNHEQSDQL
jgi:uncharacterized protein YdhG (YjbR/CyaY superfamily)